MDKIIHEEHLTHPPQTYNEEFKKPLTILTGYNGILNITKEKIKFYFTVSINDDDLYWIAISRGAYDLETLDNVMKRIFIEEGFFTEATYPLTIKPIFSTSGSFVETSSSIKGSRIAFTSKDSIKKLLVFKTKVIHEEHNLWYFPVDILSFDNIFLECDIAQGMIFKGKRSRLFLIFTIDVNPGYKYIE